MSEFDDMLNSVLNDPDQMKKIMDMANSLMGSSDAPKQESKSEADTQSILSDVSKMISPDMISSVQKLMGSGSIASNDKTALVNAMGPWLSQERSRKLEKAIKLVTALRVARIFFKKSEADSK